MGYRPNGIVGQCSLQVVRISMWNDTLRTVIGESDYTALLGGQFCPEACRAVGKDLSISQISSWAAKGSSAM